LKNKSLGSFLLRVLGDDCESWENARFMGLCSDPSWESEERRVVGESGGAV